MPYRKNQTNAQIVPLAMSRTEGETKTGNMSSVHLDAPYKGSWTGRMPKVWARIFSERVRSGKITWGIYSFQTPIAWFDDEFGWVIPAVTYSPITSSKHQAHLGETCSNRTFVPGDATRDDVMRVLRGELVFVTDRQGRATGTIPGPNYISEV